MQTILGGGGAIGKALAKELKNYSNQIRIVSRTPQKVNSDDELLPADLTDKDSVLRAVEGSSIVYLVAGIPYKLKTWQTQWPVIMRNVIAACQHHQASLVFFDNVYAYDARSIPHMKEDSPVNPPSKKGAVRAAIAQMLLDGANRENLKAMIVRAADFYGPGISNSMLMETVYKNLKKGKAAYWMADPSKTHSFTYTPDAAKATALLGNTADAYNQVWHLPTSDEKLTGREWVRLFAKELGQKEKLSTVSKGLVKFLGLFNPLMKEMVEMMYQYDRDYYFDSSKFRTRFPTFRTTSYEEGVKEIVRTAE